MLIHVHLCVFEMHEFIKVFEIPLDSPITILTGVFCFSAQTCLAIIIHVDP